MMKTTASALLALALGATPALATPSPPAAPAKKLSPKKAQARVVVPKEKQRAREAAARAPRFPSVALYEANLKEEMQYRPFDGAGRPRAGAARELERFLRDHHTGRRHSVDPRLGKVLYAVARHFGHRIEVFSGYRPPEYSTRQHSRHLTGSAVDFRIPGVRNEAIVSYLRASFHPVGVGYYPNGVHVHLDVARAEDAYWVDRGDAPSPSPTDQGADESTADETVAAAPPLPVFEPGDPGLPRQILIPPGPDDDPGFLDAE